MPNFAITNPTPSRGLYNSYNRLNVMKVKAHRFLFPLGILMTSCAALISFGIAAHYNSQRIKEGNEMPPHIIPQVLHRVNWRNLNPSSTTNKKPHIVMVV